MAQKIFFFFIFLETHSRHYSERRKTQSLKTHNQICPQGIETGNKKLSDVEICYPMNDMCFSFNFTLQIGAKGNATEKALFSFSIFPTMKSIRVSSAQTCYYNLIVTYCFKTFMNFSDQLIYSYTLSLLLL